MSDIWSTNDGLYVGFECLSKNDGYPDLRGPPVELITDRHLILYGPNGSGKTRGFVYPNVLKLLDWSLVILDFKGEIYEKTAQFRREAGSKIVAINPFKVRGIPSNGYNPVSALSSNFEDPNFIDECDAIANILSPAINSGDNKHFDEAAQDLISIPLLDTYRISDRKRTLSYVRRFVNLPDPELQTEMREISKEADLAGFYELEGRTSRFLSIDGADKELKSIISTARTKLRWLDSKPIADDLMTGSYDWNGMKKKPTVVYIILPANRIYQHRGWLKLILHSILARLTNDPVESKVPIMFLLDEAAQIAGIPIIEENMAMLRSFGIKIASLYQDYPQAALSLGARVDSYIANAGALISYAPQDMKTSKMLTERSGVTMEYTTSLSLKTDAKPRQVEGSYSVSPVRHDAVLPQDLMDMPAKFAVYYSHKHNGVRTVYFPDPSDIPEFAVAMNRPRKRPSRAAR